MSPQVHPGAAIDPSAILGEGCVVGEGVSIGPGCRIGHHVVIHDGTVVGRDVRVDDLATLGKRPMRAANSATTREQELAPLTLGDSCIVGTGVVLYRGAAIEAKVLMADLCTVRENVTIGRGTIVGRGVTIENFCAVGRYCKLESECYITAYSTLEEDVFIAPCVVTTNDNYMGRTERRRAEMRGPTIRRSARVGGGAVICPGIEVGEEAFVGAGAVVTKDVPPRTVVVGSPARVLRNVSPDELRANGG